MKKFTNRLLKWYALHRRDLPWRRTRDPYHIWLSEVILQQTRVEQGTPYYYKFLELFPTVETLAAAQEQEVLKAWQGLGYYTRARNLHAAAIMIVKEHGGRFPSSWQDIRKLKGIGDYTAAAIASISFRLPFAVVDGNVIRFLSRYSGIQEPVNRPAVVRQLRELANALMDQGNPGDFNQALMEFGAMVCLPAKPRCGNCIFNQDCFAFNHQMIEMIPLKSGKPPLRNRYFNYLTVWMRREDQHFLFLRKRENKDIWRNLFDFPMEETLQEANLKTLSRTNLFRTISRLSPAGIHLLPFHKTHLLTHQRIHARFFVAEVTCIPAGWGDPVDLQSIHQFPMPRLITGFLSTPGLPWMAGND